MSFQQQQQQKNKQNEKEIDLQNYPRSAHMDLPLRIKVND